MLINVHRFDGKLRDMYTPSKRYTNDEKREQFGKLLKSLKDPHAIRTVSTIIKDLNIKQGPNYQPANDIDASDLLAELSEMTNNPDVLKGLEEQLADTSKLGICNSGRVTRLFQLWVAYSEDKDEKNSKNEGDAEDNNSKNENDAKDEKNKKNVEEKKILE